MSDEDQLSRHESESNDDEETESEQGTVEDAKDDARSVAHGSEPSKPEQNDNEDAQSHSSVETRETRTSDLFVRSIPASPLPVVDVEQAPGLYINQHYGWSSYDDYDVITVHGIRDDRKTAWRSKEGSWWVKDDLFKKLTTREIDFSYHTHEDADIFKPGGIAREARTLLTEYVAMRRELPSTETDRPVIWICHDIGGHIVKEALMIAAMQPHIYHRISLLTTSVIFLGVPHRAHSMEELEDQLHQLILLPGPHDIKRGIVQKVRSLAEDVATINAQFYESKLTTRAQVINIFSIQPTPLKKEEEAKEEAGKGPESEDKPNPPAQENQILNDESGAAEVAVPNTENDPDKQDEKPDKVPNAIQETSESEKQPDPPPVITPFPRYNALMGYPFETHGRYRCDISHLDLVKGAPVGPDDDETWVSSYSELFNTTGFTIQLNRYLLQDQGKILSLVPPRRTTSLPFEPDLPKLPFINWIYEQEPYKDFRKKGFGPSILYLHGGQSKDSDKALLPDVSRISQTLYLSHDLDTFEEYNILERGIVYFEFNKHDSRYNNIRAMLVTFLNDIIWHFWDDLEETMTDIFENLNRSRSWTLEDLYFVFTHLRDFVGSECLTFFISCFDECDEREREWFLQRVLHLQSLSDTTFKIIISTNDSDKFLTNTLPSSSIIDLGKCPALAEDRKTFGLPTADGLEGAMRNLLKRRTVYEAFEAQIQDLIGQCKEQPHLGYTILTWLSSYKRGASKAKLEEIIKKLSPATPQNLLNVFLEALDSKRQEWAKAAFNWIRHAAEPLTPEILGQAIALTLSPDDDVSLLDIDPTSLKHELDQVFAGLIIVDGRDIKFGHDSLYDIAGFDLEGSSTEDAAVIHKQIAETCLHSLKLKEGQEILAATLSVEQYGGLESGAIMLPRASLAEYAVRSWAEHYTLAGEHAPNEQALAFFKDREALHTWAEADYVASNGFTRVHYSYFSPLPYIARLGLDDLAWEYLQAEKAQPSENRVPQNQSYWDAIVETARIGNKDLVLRLLDVADIDEARLSDAISWAAAYGKGGALDELVARAQKLDGFSWPALILGRAAIAGLDTLIQALAKSEHKMDEPIMSDGRVPIILAVDWGQEDALKALLEAKADITVRDRYENTPLLLAAKRGNPTIVQLLLDNGSDVRALDKSGASTVHCAVDFARSKVLEVLIGAGAEVNSGNNDPEAAIYTRLPIVHGADRGYEDCVRILLKNGADAKADSPQGTALYLAVQAGHVEIARMLLEKGADPNQTYMDKDMLLLRAIATKKKELVELLIDNPYNNNANINAFDPSGPTYNTPLVRSIETGLLDVAKLLLDKNADVNFVGEGSDSPLYVAAFFGHVELTKILLAKGADLTWQDSDGWTPLHAAYNNLEILDLLLKKGADINSLSNDGTVVMIAARWGYPKSLRFLLSRTPKPDLEVTLQYDTHVDYTSTALLVACRNGHHECVKLLLEAGAKVDHKTNDGSYALEYCLEQGGAESENTLKELLKFNPNLKESDSNGDTVLHSINATAPLSVVQLLVEKGAPANAANNDGRTPLTVAVESNNMEVARYLVQECKVNVNVYGPKFGSILHVAAGQGDLDMVKLLIEAKADHSAVDRDYGESVLYTALGNFDFRMRGKIVRYLIETAGVDVNARGGRLAYPIIRAASENNESLLKYLIRRQADFNVADDLGRRPIHLAAATSEWNVMALVRAGAELNVRDKYGRSPVHFAAGVGDVPVLEVLLKPPPEENFQVGLVDNDGWTPLMWSCRSNWSEWNRQALLDKLIDEPKEALWARSKDNEWSPLKLANYHGWMDEYKARLGPSPDDEQWTRKDRDGQEEVWNSGFHKSREGLARFSTTCSSCMMMIRGIQWKCVECTTTEFNLCFKCFPQRSTMHDKEHHFEEIGPQFVVLSRSSVARSEGQSEGEESEEEETPSEEESDDGEDDDADTEADDDD